MKRNVYNENTNWQFSPAEHDTTDDVQTAAISSEASSRSMPIRAHNQNFMFFKKQLIILYGIYFIKNYHYGIINIIIILRRNLFKLTHYSSI